jgi:hypothetical protein
LLPDLLPATAEGFRRTACNAFKKQALQPIVDDGKLPERRKLTSPQTGALTELRYAPTLKTKHLGASLTSTNHELPPICRPTVYASKC